MTVLIAGAGPAGARLAIGLSRAGAQVALVDRLNDPVHNAYSSAAIPLDDARRLSIPRKSWSASWSGWQLLDPNGLEHQWWATQPLGVVLDFGCLRAAMWNEALESGVELLAGCNVQLESLNDAGASIQLRFHDGQRQRRQVRWLIDATGSRRELLNQAGAVTAVPSDPLLRGIGAEWLIQADDRRSAPWRDRISFFLGTQWIAHGYGWVFPMRNHQLKVGVCQLPPEDAREHVRLLSRSLEKLLHHCKLNTCPVLDRHGGVVSSSVARKEPLGLGALLAVGDAASTANLLGGEGIRHAMDSADQLASVLINNFDGEFDSVRMIYRQRLRQWLGWRWPMAGRLARRTWFGLDHDQADRRLARLIEGLSTTGTAETLSELLFRYRFESYGLRLLPYLF